MSRRNKDSCASVVALAALIVFFIIASKDKTEIKTCHENLHGNNSIKYWAYVENDWNPNDNLRTIKRVFNRLGHEMANGNGSHDWDVMWSIEYPFKTFMKEMKNLKPHQRVNHFPGINFITYKAFMNTNNFFDFIPATFELPRMIKSLIKFMKTHPKKKFVQKNDTNRGVKIVPINDKSFGASKDTIYQEFIDNPLLIDGHAFDLGVYVLISSIDPLRIYR